MSPRALSGYALRRLAAAGLILLVVSGLTFLFIHFAPGGPEETLAGRFSSPEQREAIRAEYGLDDPLPVQFGRFLSGAAVLDFGESLTSREPVLSAMVDRLGVTAPLVLISFVLTWVVGTTAGTFVAHHRGKPVDRVAVGLAIAGASSPAFATAIILLFVFGVELGWFPTFGAGEGLSGRLTHLALPVLTLTFVGVAAMLKMTRARVIQVLEEDHVTFARARGLSRRYVLSRSVLRNAGIQVVTQSGVVLLGLVSAAILVEETFNLDGLGSLFVESIVQRDIPMVQGITLLIAALIVLVNLALDLVYFALDPRVRVDSRAPA